jgi:hypothetical protein
MTITTIESGRNVPPGGTVGQVLRKTAATDYATAWATPSSGGGAADSFETVAKNLSADGATLAYSGGELATVTYASGVVKTLAYSAGRLATVTLSGATPDGIALVKTLSYTGDDLTGVAYS